MNHGRHRHLLTLTTILVVLIATPSWAGQFEVQEVFYDRLESSVSDNTRVLVGARALYVGEMDDMGNQWNLWTGLKVGFGDFEFNGDNLGGSVTEEGQTIELSASMGAFQDIDNCTPAGDGVHYVGKGVVSIYHGNIFLGMGGGPEIHEKQGVSYRTNCTSPPEEDGPGDGPDGGTSTAPADGTDDTGSPTPILIDLDRGGFKLTDLAGGVRFDLNRDGIAESLSWTETGNGDGWLALDRNGNGSIDDGGELFGNFTDQPAADEPHGYLALQVFDDDGDGRIGSNDAVYPDLLLWVDRDHDGVSDPSELTDVATAGVDWIDLDFVESRGRDRHGNEFRYRANVRLRRGVTQSRDVFLLNGP